MSAEVYGKDPASATFVSGAAHQAAEILVATGEAPAVAFTSEQRVAEYAIELVLTALVQSGALDSAEVQGGYGDDHLEDVVVLADCAINPEHVAFYEECFDIEHPEVGC